MEPDGSRRPLLVMAFLVLLGAWLEAGPGSYGPPPPRHVVPVATPRPAIVRDYDTSLTRLEERRIALANRYDAAATDDERVAVLADARATVFDALTGDIVPAWIGTRWSFNGTSQTPGAGSIACGYFVATVLRDAGFEIDRVPLAQKGSAAIVEDLVPDDLVQDTEGSTPSQVIASARGDLSEGGLFVIGFDSHVGLLVVSGSTTQLCHSSNRSPRTVRCEPAASAKSMVSSRHVLGPVLSDESMLAWLTR